MKKWTKQIIVLWLILISLPMLMLATQIGNTYTTRTRIFGNVFLTEENEITVFDVLQAYVVAFIGSLFVVFFVTIEQEKPKTIGNKE